MQYVHHIFASASAKAPPLGSHRVSEEWLIRWTPAYSPAPPVKYQGTSTSQPALPLQTSHLEGHPHLQVEQRVLANIYTIPILTTGWTQNQYIPVCHHKKCFIPVCKPLDNNSILIVASWTFLTRHMLANYSHAGSVA